MKPIIIWVMLIFNTHADVLEENPYVMGVWYQQNGEATCRLNTENWNKHHLSYIRAECIKYGPTDVSSDSTAGTERSRD